MAKLKLTPKKSITTLQDIKTNMENISNITTLSSGPDINLGDKIILPDKSLEEIVAVVTNPEKIETVPPKEEIKTLNISMRPRSFLIQTKMNGSTEIVGEDGLAVSLRKGISISGKYATSRTDDFGLAISGEYGTSIVGLYGIAATGENGVIGFKYWDGTAYSYISYRAGSEVDPYRFYRLKAGNLITKRNISSNYREAANGTDYELIKKEEVLRLFSLRLQPHQHLLKQYL